jgi:transposase
VGVKRKQHSAEFKARVAMAALSGERTLAQLSWEFGIHPTMISTWNQELMNRASGCFGTATKRRPCARTRREGSLLRIKLAAPRGSIQIGHNSVATAPDEFTVVRML